MPSAFAHAAAAGALGAWFQRAGVPRRFVALGAVYAALPDFDVLAFRLGIPYAHPLGHRGLTHALAFAAVVGAGTAWLARRSSDVRPRALALYLAAATASHGLLDMLTDGGLGVALLAPYDWGRYFFPFRPIQVSPIGVGRFFSERGLAVLRSEAVWVGLPSALLALMAWLIPRRRGRQGHPPPPPETDESR